MDAYSYIGRGEVFANAQTGNMLLLGVHLSEGNIPAAIRYLCPVLAFTFGIALADIVRNSGIGSHLHWRQISVVAEAIILTIVSFLPQSHNLLANSLTSLACGIQVESFRKIHGNGIATTMCIGNLRSGTQNIYTFFQTKKEKLLKKGFSITELSFALSAGRSSETSVLNTSMNGQSLYLPYCCCWHL